MPKTVTDKQLQANRANAKKGGVKTPEGKEQVKFNALKHGILSSAITKYESGSYHSFQEQLHDEFQPVGFIEELLVERVALCHLRLHRASMAEKELMKSALNPGKSGFDIELDTFGGTKGYTPVLNTEHMRALHEVYLRYETMIENRMYKALHELERLQRRRDGEHVPAPVAVDVSHTDGFVSQK